MFRNSVKRAWLAVVRKPSKSIILGLILFAMANLICATIAINKSVDESVKYAKETLGGVVYLQPDVQMIRTRAMEEAQQNQNDSTGGGMRMSIQMPSVPIETVHELAESEYVKDYSYSLSSGAKSVDFDAVDGTNGSGGQMMRIPGGDSSFVMPDMQVQAMNAFAFVDRVKNNTLTYDGEYFDESTENGVMISADLADENGFEIGDTLKLQNTFTDETIELKIIGIYTVTEDGYNANLIYTNIETAAKFLSEEQYADGGYGVQSVAYYMTNAEYSQDFIAEINAKYPTLAENDLILEIDESAYNQMVGPITSVGSFATIVLAVVIAASVVIVTLIVTLNVRERRYEMGVLMSLGASRTNVLGAIFMELLIVGTVFFGLSIGTSQFLAQTMGENLLSSQVAMSEQQQEENFGRGMNAGPNTSQRGGPSGMMVGGPLFSMGGVTSSEADPIDEIDVSVGVETYAMLFATGYLVLLLAMIIPGANIMRYQPREILSGKE